MNDLVEIRGATFAFEVRNGVKVEYAAGDREARMRALGCPEAVLKQLREAKRNRPAKAVPLTDEQCARMNGQTLDEYFRRKDMAERSVRLTRCGDNARTIAAQTDADLRARAAAAAKRISADAAQEVKDDALRERMETAAGRTYRKCRGK
jgi:hypothetical protein